MVSSPDNNPLNKPMSADGLLQAGFILPTRADCVATFRLNAAQLTLKPSLVMTSNTPVKRTSLIYDMMQNFVGMEHVKEQLSSYLNIFKLNSLRTQYGLPARAINTHMVFTGNPGTGKTSVARMMGQIFKDAGILPYGHVVETSPHDMFTSSYAGDEITSMSKKINAALGGVLFIDEAHNFPEHAANSSEFWRNGIATLMTAMTKPSPHKFSVILAGYDDGMKHLFQLEPGLKSRFPNMIHFKDYTQFELAAMFERYAHYGHFHLADGCQDMVLKSMHAMPHKYAQNFGNARFVQNFFDETIKCVADRIGYLPFPTKNEVSTITLFDIKTALDKLHKRT